MITIGPQFWINFIKHSDRLLCCGENLYLLQQYLRKELVSQRMNQARGGRGCYCKGLLMSLLEKIFLAYNFSPPVDSLFSPLFSYFRVFHQCITLIKGKGITSWWTLPCSSLRLCSLSSQTNT